MDVEGWVLGAVDGLDDGEIAGVWIDDGMGAGRLLDGAEMLRARPVLSRAEIRLSID